LSFWGEHSDNSNTKPNPSTNPKPNPDPTYLLTMLPPKGGATI